MTYVTHEPPNPPAPRKRRRSRALLAAGAVAGALVLVAAVVAVILLTRNPAPVDRSAPADDPGVVACKTSAKVAAEKRKPTPAEDAQMVTGLATSQHANLRAAGVALVAAAKPDVQLDQAMNAVVGYVTACATHGVALPLDFGTAG